MCEQLRMTLTQGLGDLGYTSKADMSAGSMNRAPLVLLYLNVLIIATCGLVYELLAGTLASYLLGDSVTQFSLVIGLYLSAMGTGAWISRFVVDKSLARCFIEVELGVALVGGLSAPLLFAAFSRVDIFGVVLYGFVFAIGSLVGLELPLLMRLLKEHLDFEDLVSRVLAFDYIGALLASLMFPIFLVPRLGLIRTSLLCGLLNAVVGVWGTYLLRPLLNRSGLLSLRIRGALVIGLLLIAFAQAESCRDSCGNDPLSTTGADSIRTRLSAVPQRASAVQLNGRVSLSRSTRSSRTVTDQVPETDPGTRRR
jgi:spermidine synthase